MPNPETTTKVGAGTNDVALESVTPASQEEVEAQQAKEALGDGAATEPLRQGSLGTKSSPDTVGTNPKRTDNSRPD